MPSMALLCVYLHSNGPKEVFTHYSVCVCVCVCLCVCVWGGSLGPYLFPSAQAKVSVITVTAREGGREGGRDLPDIVWWSNQRKELWLFELTELRVTGSRCQS